MDFVDARFAGTRRRDRPGGPGIAFIRADGQRQLSPDQHRQGRGAGTAPIVGMPDGFTQSHRASVISATARNNVPAVYPLSLLAREGGLLSYGNDVTDTFRRAATYVDRILRGEKPAELPVQLPTKFEMVVNLKTAKALGLVVPPSILLRADEVIE